MLHVCMIMYIICKYNCSRQNGYFKDSKGFIMIYDYKRRLWCFRRQYMYCLFCTITSIKRSCKKFIRV